MEEENKITKTDYAVVLERFLAQGYLNDDDIQILKNSPFCTCDVLSETPDLSRRFQEYMKQLVVSHTTTMDKLPDYVALDCDITTEWYHPEFEGYVPVLPNVHFTQLRDENNNLYIVEEYPTKIEKYLIDNGYDLIRFDYSKAFYYKKQKKEK